MTEETRITSTSEAEECPPGEAALCIMGRSLPDPCPYPATVPLPHRLGGDDLRLCAYHAATEPLVDESEELNVSLELVRAYLKGARRHGAAGPLVTILERAEADFSEREAVVDKVLADLKAAEYALMRG
jgi:hypothetical protein